MTLKTNLIATVAALSLAGSITGALSAQDFSKVEIKAEALRGNISVLYGAGGNIGVSAGDDGVFIVDDQFAPLTDKIKAALAGISDKPLRFVLNTHFHGDHTGGNENLGKGGAVIMAHDNVRQRLSKGAFLKAFDMKMDPAKMAALPVVTFNDKISLHMNGEEARVIHVKNAHTDGDSIIFFKGSNVIHMGDTFFNDRLPFMDVSNGGSIDGVIAAAKAVLELANDETIVIPGHGKVTDKAGVQAYLVALEASRKIVAAMKAEGKSLEDIQASGALADVNANWRANPEGWVKKYIGFVYNSLK